VKREAALLGRLLAPGPPIANPCDRAIQPARLRSGLRKWLVQLVMLGASLSFIQAAQGPVLKDNLPVLNPVQQTRTLQYLPRIVAGVLAPSSHSWWGRSHLLLTLAALVFAVLGWVIVLRRRVRTQTALLRATLESTPDGILVTDLRGRIMDFNKKFLDLIGTPESPVATQNHLQAVIATLPKLKGPDAVLAHVRELYANPDSTRDDILEFKDGRVFERHSEPQRIRGRSVGRVWNFRDITKRRRAEEELDQSRQMLQAILDAIPQRVFWKDRNSLFLGCNQAFATDAGLKDPAEIVGKSDYDLSWKETADLYRADDKQVMDRGEARLNFEEPQNKQDGNRAWLRTSKLPLRDREGKVTGVIGIYEDITEQKRAQEQLHLQAAALESAANGIVIADESGKILWVNHAFSALTGYSAEEAIGQTPRLLKSGKHGPEFYETLWSTITSGLTWYGEIINRRKDGKLYIEEMTITPVRNVGGSIAYFIAVKQDITARKEAEVALSRSEEKFRSLITNIPDVIWTADENWNPTFISQNIEALTGYKPAEFYKGGSTIWFRRIHPDDVQKVHEGVKSLFRDNKGFDMEYRLRRRDGTWIWVHDRAVKTYERDGLRFADGILSDITERKRLEFELRQAQKLESVGRLAAGIAHEINTPIQFVGDNTRFLQESFAGLRALIAKFKELKDAAGTGVISPGLLEEVRKAEQSADLEYLEEEIPKALDQTLEGVERVATIVRAMKDFAHSDLKEKAAADLNKALASTLVVARNELKYVAEVETEFGELPPVLCNVSDMNQVFLNLLVNSAHAIGDVVKGTGKKGLIRVRTGREDDDVVISISDTGCGIPENIRSKIFDPFFTTKEMGRGTGQGLAIARSIVVDKHGGTLTFESEPGKGTTFYIRLPLAGSHGQGGPIR
jgi:two-component system NtrC family sensor kinase